MERYKNLSGKKSGVVAFEIEDDSITVQFENGWFYLYTEESAGISNIAEMKRLAINGQGLNGFINRAVRHAFARKWH